MTEIKTYSSSENYIKDAGIYLEENELENNIILGYCNKVSGTKSVNADSHFIACFDDSIIKSTSMIADHRAIVYGENSSVKFIGLLAEYYFKNSVPLSGVMGLSKSSIIFSDKFHKGKSFTRDLLLHELTKTSKLKLPDGTFEKADTDDLKIVSDLEYKFITESDIVRGRTRTDVLNSVNNLIKNNSVFKWTVGKKIVCISTIVRNTKNTAIIGLVYTPEKFRGNGYATGCVLKLSEHILQSGFKICGLYTDILNPVSNSIYKKIGYDKKAEFKDIRFL